MLNQLEGKVLSVEMSNLKEIDNLQNNQDKEEKSMFKLYSKRIKNIKKLSKNFLTNYVKHKWKEIDLKKIIDLILDLF